MVKYTWEASKSIWGRINVKNGLKRTEDFSQPEWVIDADTEDFN
jgi:hypothetical protein